MKICYSTVGMRDSKLKYIVPEIAEMGYAGVDILGQHLIDFLEADGTTADLKKMLEDEKLVVPALSPSFDFTGDEAERKESLRLGKKFIGWARELDIPVIRALTGHKSAENAADEDWKTCTGAIQELCDEAVTEGVCLALTAMPQNLTNSVENILKMLDMVNYPNLRVIYDAWHVYREGAEDPIAAIDTLWDRLVHVHARNKTRKRKGPFGTDVTTLDKGDLDYIQVLQKLKAKGYKGFVSIEWYGFDRTETWDMAEYEAAWLKKYI